MPLNQQQRSLAILGGVFGGGLLITFLLVSLVSGGDDERNVSIRPRQPTTTSSTTTTSTLPPTVPTLPPTIATVPPTIAITTQPTISPGTIQTTPTTKKPVVTTPTTKKPPSSTTPTTKPKTPAQKLDAELEEALRGDEEPPPGEEPDRVTVVIDEQDNEIRIRWDLDESLSDEEQWYQARFEAATMLEVIQGSDQFDDEDVILRGRVTNTDLVPIPPKKTLVRVLYENATLKDIDFDTFDPLTVFDTPPADDATVNPPLDASPPPSTTTTTSTTIP